MSSNHSTASYSEFLKSKSQASGMAGFEPLWLPDFLFDFQRHLVDWSVRKGLGIELKESYCRQACKNVPAALLPPADQPDLFHEIPAETEEEE